MFKILKSPPPPAFAILAVFSLLLSLAATPLSLDDPSNKLSSHSSNDDPELTVTVTSSTSVLMEWNSWGDLGNYQITVRNLGTLEVEQSFSTSALSASISNLSTGVTYRFSTNKNGFVIAEDVIM